MKILRIDFKNINNLKGEHSIAFDQMPLSTAGIFAITGPTGAGKSSILDVITLALFNRIPRFKKAISKGEMEGLGSVITHHTIEASAAITYEIKGVSYQSEWKIAKTKKGNLKEYEMFIYDASGQPLDIKRKEVPSKNEEIIGLKYDQFIKSILLSQGEFSKFLKAGKNERGELLEDITGSYIYRKIGKAAFNKNKEVKDALDLKKEILGNTQVFDEEERQQTEAKIIECNFQKEELDKALVLLVNLRQVKTELNKITKNIIQKEQAAAQLELDKVDFQPELKMLQLFEKLRPVQADLALYKTTSKSVQDFQIKTNQCQTQLASAESKLQSVMAEMTVLTKEKVDAKNFKKVMSAFEKVVNDFDRDLENILEKGKEQKSRMESKIGQYPISLKDQKARAALGLLQKRLPLLLENIKQASIEKTVDVGKIKTQLKTWQQEFSLLKDLQRSNTSLADLLKKLAFDKTSLADFQDTKNAKKPLFEKTVGLVASLESVKTLLQKQKQDALLIAGFEDQRLALQDNQPCPLCGALHHPFAEHLPEQKETEIDENIKKNKFELEQQIKEQNTLQKDLTACETSIKMTQRNVESKETELNQAQKSNQKLKDNYGGDANVGDATLPQTLKDLETKIAQTDQAISALEEIKINEELSAGYQELEQISLNYQDLNNQRKEKFEGKNVSAACNDLQEKFVTCNTTITKLKTSLEKDTQSLNYYNNRLTEIVGKLNPKVQALGFASIEAMNDSMLDEQEVTDIQAKKESLTRRETENNTELKNLQKNKTTRLKLDTSPAIDLQTVMLDTKSKEQTRENLVHNLGEKRSQLKRDDDDRKKIATQEKEIESLKKSYQKWGALKNLIGDAQGNTFANFAQGMTLQNLLVYANKRLLNLSDRYLLDKPTGDGALMIIDQYQGNIQRAVTTLSGGESFLISLALALSLSDMASKNVSLDSLFIDEGFGTLDQETLDMALNTLEKLQSESQKTVGVISHVETLKERINVQIKLEKNPQGYSSIRVE